jgi:hypothetical protein
MFPQVFPEMLPKHQGYKSQTTSTSQMCIKGPAQWVGEDALIYKPGELHKYSAIALTNMVCY